MAKNNSSQAPKTRPKFWEAISVKFIIIFWFTLLMVIVSALVMVFMLTVSRLTMEQDMQRRVLSGVKANSNDLKCENDTIQAKGGFQYYVNGVYCLIYDANCNKVAGEYPEGFYTNAGFEDGVLRTTECGGKKYYIYDSYLTFKNGRHAWIRGVSLTTTTVTVASTVAKVASYVLPGVVVASAIGGYFITRAALKPIDEITKMSDEISEGRDLSRRLNMRNVTMEAYILAQSYDKMLERLERSFDMEKQFTSDASHELRTPTAVIISQCEYAQEHDATPEEFQDTIAIIKRQARRMNAMVSQLLSFARMEQGTQKVKLEHADISDIVEAVCEEQAELNPEVDFQCAIDPGICSNVDITLMSRLVENLITNACKFGGKHVKVGLYEEDGQIYLFVRDDGIGISPENQKKVWDRFWQAEPSRSDNRQGSNGLGLSMVREIAKLHRGEMSLQSAPRQGSTFTLKMPKEE